MIKGHPRLAFSSISLIMGLSLFLTLFVRLHVAVFAPNEFLEMAVDFEEKEVQAYLLSGWSWRENGTVFLLERKGSLEWRLPPDAYAVRLTLAESSEGEDLGLKVNGIELRRLFRSARRIRFVIPRNIMKNRNLFEIETLKQRLEPVGVSSLKLKNHLVGFRKFPKLGVLPDSSNLVNKIKDRSWNSVIYIISFLAFSLSMALFSILQSELIFARFQGWSGKITHRFVILCFLPGFSFLVFLHIGSILSAFYFICGPWTFLFLVLGIAIFVEGSVLALKFIHEQLLLSKRKAVQRITLVKDPIKKTKLSSGNTYILLFMCLLAICAILLVLGLEKAAEQVANFAYFSLVIGVGIKLYQFIKEKKRTGKEDES